MTLFVCVCMALLIWSEIHKNAILKILTIVLIKNMHIIEELNSSLIKKYIFIKGK